MVVVNERCYGERDYGASFVDSMLEYVWRTMEIVSVERKKGQCFANIPDDGFEYRLVDGDGWNWRSSMVTAI